MKPLEIFLLIEKIGFMISIHDNETIILFYFEHWHSNGFPIGVIPKED